MLYPTRVCFYIRSSTFQLSTGDTCTHTHKTYQLLAHPNIKFYSCYLASLFEGISSISICTLKVLQDDGTWHSPQWAEGQRLLRFIPVSPSYTQSYCWLKNSVREGCYDITSPKKQKNKRNNQPNKQPSMTRDAPLSWFWTLLCWLLPKCCRSYGWNPDREGSHENKSPPAHSATTPTTTTATTTMWSHFFQFLQRMMLLQVWGKSKDVQSSRCNSEV